MSANNYYGNKPLPDPTPSPQPYHYNHAYNDGPVAGSGASTYSAAPPSYHSEQPYRGPPSSALQPNQVPQRIDTVSPFESVFDDHVYPVNSRQDSVGGVSSIHSNRPYGEQQQQYGGQPYGRQQDTAYHGLAARSPSEDNMPSSDDIPLRNRPPKGDTEDRAAGGLDEGPDHVYDARQKKSRKGGIRFGELGMFGANRKKIPFVVYFFTIVQVAVFIGEIVRNAQLTGSPIMIQPSFNPMIGPSTQVLINMGGRFVPCMHNVEGVQETKDLKWWCPNSTTSDPQAPSNQCSLSELCGFGGVPNPAGVANQEPEPNQWFRFIIPIFMHAGIIHIAFNMLLQLTLGREMEKSIGAIRFFIVYMSAGIFGFVMGGNYAATGIVSTGASGALFGIIALTLLDLLYSWKDRVSPVKDLMFILLDVIISFVLGLLPGLDNFSHIGGFLMGLALGISVLHSPNSLRRRIGEDPSYATVNAGYVAQTSPTFLSSPVAFFKGRKPLWWAWWLLRAGAIVLVVVVFILLLNNFYIYHNTCDWCKYLSCLPVNNWCTNGNLELVKTGTPSKRDFIPGWETMGNLY